jgi:serine protease
MKHRRASLLVLALAPILALVACDQVSRIVGGGQEGGGPAALTSVPLAARALAGVVRPASEMAEVLREEPVLVAPGEIMVGAQVEQRLDEAAAGMNVTGSVVQRLQREGTDALRELPQLTMKQVRARAEAAAAPVAQQAAQNVLSRLGIEGEVRVRPGGVVTIDLARPGPPSGILPFTTQKQAAAPTRAAEAAEPAAIEWTGERCPRLVNVQQLEQDLAMATRCAIARLEASGQFEYVEPNFIITANFDRLPWAKPKEKTPPGTTPTTPPTTPTTPETPAEPSFSLPNDPLEALQWHYRARGTGAGQSLGGAGFETFWVQGRQTGSRNVRIAIIDTGIDKNHPEIAGSGNLAAGVDLISNVERAGDSNGVDDDPLDVGDRCGTQTESSYHGTHVAGTAGVVRTNDRVGVAGGVWTVSIVPVRVLGRCGGELADISSGIRWAAGLAPAVLANGQQLNNPNRADIINMSLSVAVACPASMQAAIDAAVAAGSVVVVAAGNKANQVRNYAPANCSNVVVVGAGDGQGNLAFYSNFGPEVDILAPGGDTFADRDGDGHPDGVLSSRSATSGCIDPASAGAAPQTCHYTYLQGTSMAAPHVSAALALLASQTGLRGRDLENALFTRALGPIDPAQCRIECSRNRNATPIPGDTTMCMRACGRGMLDLARAATAPVIAQPAAPAPGGPPVGTSPRRR